MVSPIDNRGLSQIPSSTFENLEGVQEKIESCDLRKLPPGQFALMHGDAFILNSGLEGGQSARSLEYWSSLANQLQKGELEDLKELFDPFGNPSPVDFDKMTRALSFAEKAEKLLKQSEDSNQMKLLYEGIRAQLQNEGVAYLPLSYCVRGQEKMDGHAFGMMLKRDERGQLIAYFLNKGEGSEKHPILLVNPQKVMRSYKSYPIKFHDQTLFSTNEGGSKSLLRFLSLFALTPASEQKPYTGSEIYKYLSNLGQIQVAEGEFSEEMAVTSSRSGVCSEAVARLIIRDAMVHSNASNQLLAKNSYKRFILFGEMASLIQKIKEDSSLSPHLIVRSAQEFAYSALKKYEREEISLEELSHCQMIEKKIREKYEPKMHEQKLEQLPIKSAESLAVDPGVSIFPAPSEDQGEAVLVAKYLQELPKETPAPADCLAFLQKAIAERAKDKNDAIFLSNIEKLPIPLGTDSKGLNEPYWSQIPKEQVDDLLEALHKCFSDCPWKADCLNPTHYFLFQLSILSIYDVLARSKKEMKLEGFNPLAEILSDLKEKEKRGILHLRGEESLRYGQILDYLEKRGERPIFLSLKKEEKVPLRKEGLSGGSPLHYYDQFTSLFSGIREKLPWDRKIWELALPNPDMEVEISHKAVIEYNLVKVEGGKSSGTIVKAKYKHLHKQFKRLDFSVGESNVSLENKYIFREERLAKLPAAYHAYREMHCSLMASYYGQEKFNILPKAQIKWENKPLADQTIYSEEFLSQKDQQKMAEGRPKGGKRPDNYSEKVNTYEITSEEFNAVFAEYKFTPSSTPKAYPLKFRFEHSPNALLAEKEHEMTLRGISSAARDPIKRSLAQGGSYAIFGNEKKVPLFFDWLKAHAHLEDPNWKSEFQKFLLQSRGGVGTWLNLHLEDDLERKAFIASLRSFLDGVVGEFANSSNFSETVWWIRLSAHVESHLLSFLPNENRSDEDAEVLQKRISFLQEKLSLLEKNLVARGSNSLKDQVREINAQQLYLHMLRPEIKKSDLKHFIYYHFQQNIVKGWVSENTPLWVKIDGSFWAGKYGKAVEAAVADRAFLEELLLSLQPLLGLPSQKLDWKKEGDYPIYNLLYGGISYKIDLVAGLGMQNGKVIESSSWPDEFLAWSQFDKFLDRKAIPEAIKSGNRYYTEDGLLSWSKMKWGSSEEWVFGKVGAVSSDPKSFYFLIEEKNYKSIGLPAALCEGRQLWFHPENKSYKVTWPNGEPYALIDSKGIYKLNAKGEKSGEVLLVDSKETDFGRFLNQFMNSSKVLLWKKEGKVSAIEFPHLEHLLFTLTPEGHYLCEQFPEYHLAPEQENGILLKGCPLLIHKKEKDKRAAIFPFKKMNNLSPFSREIESGWSDTFFEEGGKGRRIFFYEVDRKNERLRAEDYEGQLFLTYVLIKKGAYAEALESLGHLTTSPRLSARSREILHELLKETPCRDPIVSALILRLLWSARRDRLPIALEKKLGESIKAHWQNYNQYQKSELYSHILEAYRLPQEQWEDVRKLYDCPVLYSNQLEQKTEDADEISSCINTVFNKPKGSLSWRLDSLSWRLDSVKGAAIEVPVPEDLGYSDIKTRWSEGTTFFKWVALILASPANQLAACDFILLNYLHNGDQNQKKLVEILFFIRRYQKDFKGVDLEVDSIIKRIEWVQKRRISDRYANRLKVDQEISIKSATANTAIKVRAKNEQRIDSSPPLKQENFSYSKRPLGNFVDDYFDLEQREVYKGNQKKFALVEREGESDLARKSRLKLEETHENLIKNKQYTAYSLKNGKAATELRKELKAKIKISQNRIKEHRERIMQLAKGPSDEEFSQLSFDKQQKVIEYRSALSGGQKRAISFQKDILLGLAEGSLGDLQKLNPFITSEQLQEIENLALQYLLEGSAIDQGKEALDWVDRACKEPDKAESFLTQAASILNKKREYNPSRHPMLLFYEYASGMMLRNQPNQAALLKTIFKELFSNEEGVDKADKIRRLMFEFQAGGGKTKVISAIVAAHVISKGKVPIFFSLPELFEVSKEDLRHALDDILHKGTQAIHITLQDQLDQRKLEEILTTLQIAKKEKQAIIMTPESYHAIKLGYRMALLGGDKNLVAVHSQIRQFFLQNVVGLVDESHRNADSLLHDNIAFGRQKNLPVVHRSWLFMLLKTLAGRTKDPLYTKSGKLVADVVRLHQNNQAKMAEEEKQEVQEALKEYLSTHSALGVPVEKQKEVIQFWSDPKMAEPQWLAEKAHSKNEGEFREAQLIYLTRGLFVDEILPTTLGLTGEIDYKAAMDPLDPVPSPAKQGNPSTAKYEQPDIAAIIAIQHYLQRGLNTIPELKKIIPILKERAKIDPLLYFRFKEWQKDSSYVFDLKEIHLGDLPEAKLQLLLRAIGQVPEVVDLFITEAVLPQVTYSPFKLSTTPSDIVNDSFATLLFSATLGVQEKYPWLGVGEEGRFLQDFPFLAEVMHRACLPHNQRKLWVHPKSPTEFFQEIYKKYSSEFETRLDGIINYGGMCEELPSHAWSEALLNFSHEKKLTYDGTVYFATYRELGISPKEGESLDTRKLVVRLKDRLHPYIIEGSNLKAELKRLGLENKRLFKIYAPQDTTGTDLALAPNAMMAITFGGNADLISLAQAILRERGFLNESIDENSQSLIWVGFPKVKEKIQSHLGISTDPTNEQIFQWALDQGSEKQISAVQALVYQEIDFVISRNIDRQMDQAEFASEKIDIGQQHQKAFIKSKEHIPRNVYSAGRDWLTEKEEVRAHFQRHAEGRIKEAKAILTDEENEHIKVVIDRAIKLITEILDRKGESTLSTAQQQLQQQEEAQVEAVKEAMVRNQGAGLQAIDQKDYAKGNLSLNSPDLLKASPPHASSVSELLDSKFFKDLLVTEDAWNVLKMAGMQETIFTKPACCFLMIKKGNSYRPMVISVTNKNSYEEQINQGKTLEGCQFCLFSMTGVPLKNGKGGAGLSEEEFESPEFQAWLQDMLPRIQLMSGKILKPLSPILQALFESEEGRATLNRIWKKVEDSLETPEEMDHTRFNSLMAEQIAQDLVGESIQGEYLISSSPKGEGGIKKAENNINKEWKIELNPSKAMKEESLKVSQSKNLRHYQEEELKDRNKNALHSTWLFFRTQLFLFPFALLTLGIFPLAVFLYYRRKIRLS